MTSTDYLQAQLAVRAWKDGGSEGLNGALAVCFVFRNRIRAGWFGGNWAEVLAHHRDVSYRIEPDTDEMPNPSSNYNFFLLLQQIDDVFNGSKPDTILVSQDQLPPPLSPQYSAPTALYFGRLDQITNPFFLENIARKTDQHKVIAQVGMLHFLS